MRIRGLIHMIELDQKVIGIQSYKKIIFLYFQNSQMNMFKRYLYQDNWIDLEYDDSKVVKKGSYNAYLIDYVYRIEAIGKLERIVYYDKLMLNKSLSNFLSNLKNTMFLDLEMTMPSFNFKGKGIFKTELIQAGFLVVDEQGKIVQTYSNYVLPKLTNHITSRAEKFLGIKEEEFFQKAITYEEFYNSFKEVLDKYDPTIIVYGRNDIIVLNDSYNINNVPSLSMQTKFVNLCQLLKNYYELRQDPGLFKLYQTYYENDDVQLHDALSDSEVTKKVFDAFKDDLSFRAKTSLIKKNFE